MKNNIELRVKAIEVKEDNYKVDLGKKVEIGIVNTDVNKMKDYVNSSNWVESTDIDYTNYDGNFFATYGYRGIAFRSLRDFIEAWAAIKYGDVKTQVVLDYHRYKDDIEVAFNHPENVYFRAMADIDHDEDIVGGNDYNVLSNIWGIMIDVAPYFILNEILNRNNADDYVMRAIETIDGYYWDIDTNTSWVVIDGVDVTSIKDLGERANLFREALKVVVDLAKDWYNESPELYDKAFEKMKNHLAFLLDINGNLTPMTVDVSKIEPFNPEYVEPKEKKMPKEVQELFDRSYNKYLNCEVDRALGKILFSKDNSGIIDIKNIEVIENDGSIWVEYNITDESIPCILGFKKPGDMAYLIQSKYTKIHEMVRIYESYKGIINEVLDGTVKCGVKEFFDNEHSDKLCEPEYAELCCAAEEVTWLLFDYTYHKILSDLSNGVEYPDKLIGSIFTIENGQYRYFSEISAGTTSNLYYDGELFDY